MNDTIDRQIEGQQNKLLLRGSYVAIGSLLGIIVGIGGWILAEAVVTGQFRANMTSRINTLELRVDKLSEEPPARMARETRVEFDMIWKRLERLDKDGFNGKE